MLPKTKVVIKVGTLFLTHFRFVQFSNPEPDPLWSMSSLLSSLRADNDYTSLVFESYLFPLYA